MKVSVSGAFSCGKTSLCRALGECLPDAIILSEIATEGRRIAPGLDWRLPDVRAYLFWAQVLLENRQHPDARLLIFDGSIIDVFAHTLAFGIEIPEHWRHFPTIQYDVTFVCDPRDVEVEDNQLRETDPVLRERLHRLIVAEARAASREVILLSGLHESRVSDAKAKLEMLT